MITAVLSAIFMMIFVILSFIHERDTDTALGDLVTALMFEIIFLTVV